MSALSCEFGQIDLSPKTTRYRSARSRPFVALSILLSAVISSDAKADVVLTDLFNTGVDDVGAALPLGAVDPHYIVLRPEPPGAGPNAFVMNNLPGSYLGNSPFSRWIWEQPQGIPVNVTRTFRTSLDLTGSDPSSADITGRWATDNFGLDYLINGISTGQTNGGFIFSTRFDITSGFVPGKNTLDFVVQDVGGIAVFRVLGMEGRAVSVPEPTSWVMLAVCSVAMVTQRSRFAERKAS